MDRVGRFLFKRMANKGLAGVAISSHICYIAEKWGKGRFAPISFSKGVLKVSVRSSVVGQEVSMESEKLIKYVNEKLDKEIVKRVQIVNEG